MGVGAPDEGLGASQAILEAFASCSISEPSKSANVTEKENEDTINTISVTIPQFEQRLNSPSHLRLTINTEAKQIEIKQVKVTLVYKGHGCDHLESTTNEEFTCGFSNIDKSDLADNESRPQVTEFDVKNVTVEANEEDEVTEMFTENKETNTENVKVLETTEAVDESRTLGRESVEKHGDTDAKEEIQYDDVVDTTESRADGVKEKPMSESENLTGKDDIDENMEEVSSDEIIPPTEEDKELFRAPSLLLVFDYRSDEWKVREFGEIIILYRPEQNYQLQFRRYQHDGYETSLVMALRESFKLHQMRYSNNQAWEWTFHYITEGGTGVFRTLAAKFLTRNVAYEFYNKIKECVMMLKNGDGVFDANSEDGFLAPSQSIRLISRTSTPTFGPALPICGTPSPTGAVGTVLQPTSADTSERSVGRSSAYWISPISSKFRKIARKTSNTETKFNHEEYKLKRTRESLTPPLFNKNNSTEEPKVALVYKCHACGLCFDRPEILLNRHLNNCAPTTKLVKTKCTCGLTFDQYNFNYHCEVHRKYTVLNVKKVVVREEKNLDVSGMKKVFTVDEMRADEAMEEALQGACDSKLTVERSVKNDERNVTEDKIEHRSLIGMHKCEMEAKANDETPSNHSTVRMKAHRVYVCQCRLCFDRAEFFIKHLSKCSLDAKVVKTTCVCDLVFDKYNFAYHCEVHRQVTILNVKYIVVRDEGILDISGMVKEFVEDEEIKVAETTKVALEETVDQSYLVNNPVAKHTVEQNGIEGKIENYLKISNAAKNTDAVSDDKGNYVIALKAEKASENLTTPHENHDTAEEIIRSQDNKTDESQEVSWNASIEVITLTKSINGEKSDIPNNSEDDKLVKNNCDVNGEKDPDSDNAISTTEEKQQYNSDTDAINSDKKTSYKAVEIVVIDENQVEENIMNENIDDKLIKNNCDINGEKDPDSDNAISTTEEKQQYNSDTDAINSDKKTSYKAVETVVKDENQVEENIMNENIRQGKTVHDQTVTVVETIDHSVDTDKNGTMISSIDDQKNNEYMKNINENQDIKEVIEENKTNKNQEPFNNATKDINVKIETNNEEVCKTPNYSELHDKMFNENDRVNNGKDPDSAKLMIDETIDISIIEEKRQCCSNNDQIDSDKKTGDTVMLLKDHNHVEENATKENKVEKTSVSCQTETVADEIELGAESQENETPKKTDDTVEKILVEDDNHVEKNITKEKEMKEKPVDHQTATVTDEIKHGTEENKTMKSTQSTHNIKETIPIPVGNDENDNKNESINEAQENETGESQKALINATREINVSIETYNVVSELSDRLESNCEIINTIDVENYQTDPNLLKSMPDKKNNDNISTINDKYQNIRETKSVGSDKKSFDVNVKNNKKENPTSNATNSNQRKSRKQGRRNANSTNNDSKRSNKGKKQ